MQEQVKNLTHTELMQQLDRMNACHDADKWLAKNRYDLRSALDNLLLPKWALWLHKQLRRPDARDIGLPASWIEGIQHMDDHLSAEIAVLKQSYITSPKQPNWNGYNQALEIAKNKWHRDFRLWLISTIVDEEDTR